MPWCRCRWRQHNSHSFTTTTRVECKLKGSISLIYLLFPQQQQQHKKHTQLCVFIFLFCLIFETRRCAFVCKATIVRYDTLKKSKEKRLQQRKKIVFIVRASWIKHVQLAVCCMYDFSLLLLSFLCNEEKEWEK